MAGRPPLFETSEDLQAKVDQYFDSEDDQHPTITGLAYFLGFASRQSLYDYEKDGEFSYTVKRARLRIENEYEKALHKQSCAGAIFALKNFGWADKQEIEQNTRLSGTINHDIDYSKLSDATLREISEAERQSSESKD